MASVINQSIPVSLWPPVLIQTSHTYSTTVNTAIVTEIDVLHDAAIKFPQRKSLLTPDNSQNEFQRNHSMNIAALAELVIPKKATSSY